MEAGSKDLVQQTGTLIQSKHDLETEAQIEKVVNRRDYYNLFYDPMPNNFSLVLVNKDLVLADYIDRYSESLRQLNVVNYNLQRFCELKFDEVEWIDAKNEKDAKHALTKWKKLISAGNSFLCFQYVSYVINAFKQNHYPVLTVLKEAKYSLILEKLVNIDSWVKSFFKLGLYLDFDRFYENLDEFLAALKEDNTLHSAIDKVEIAKEYFPSDHKGSTAIKVVMSIFFNPDQVQKPDSAVISKISQLIANIFLEDNEESVEDDSDYVRMIQPNICLSQGFKSYKKYLKLMGEVDELYDATSRYAYLKR